MDANSKIKYQNKLFITNISSRVSRYVIYELLIQVSKIYNFHYDQSKGYCFVEYETPEELEYTSNALKGVKLNGKRIYLNRVERRAKVLVKNLGTEIDTTFLWDVFNKFGPCHVKVEKRVGVVMYKKRECAAKAVKVVDGKRLGNSRVAVELSEDSE